MRAAHSITIIHGCILIIFSRKVTTQLWPDQDNNKGVQCLLGGDELGVEQGANVAM